MLAIAPFGLLLLLLLMLLILALLPFLLSPLLLLVGLLFWLSLSLSLPSILANLPRLVLRPSSASKCLASRFVLSWLAWLALVVWRAGVRVCSGVCVALIGVVGCCC